MKFITQTQLKGYKPHAVVFKKEQLEECANEWPILKKIKTKEAPGPGEWKVWNCLETGIFFVMYNLDLSEIKHESSFKRIFQAINNEGCSKMALFGIDQLRHAQSIARIGYDSLFQYQEFLSAIKKNSLKECCIIGKDRLFNQYVQQGVKIGEAMELTRTLADTPPNICTPSYLARAAEGLSEKYPELQVSVLDKKQIKALKMNSFLSVSKASAQEPKFITINYKGSSKKPPIVLIGKGITFDTGGHSLKPASSMMGMKFDMSGAATVLGILKLAAELKLDHNIIGLIPTCENIPGLDANKPDDVVVSMSGQTIEILNTDAEGRLILCDAMTYAERFNPQYVIDVATLTGSCVATFGSVATGLMGNDQELIEMLFSAGQESGDRAWPLPLWDEYDDELKSPVADMANIGHQHAGAITAGCFLKRFAKNFKWAHLDIAGTACIFQGHKRGSTGRPIPLLAEFLMNLAK